MGRIPTGTYRDCAADAEGTDAADALYPTGEEAR
jgi:hypothetical protein